MQMPKYSQREAAKHTSCILLRVVEEGYSRKLAGQKMLWREELRDEASDQDPAFSYASHQKYTLDVSAHDGHRKSQHQPKSAAQMGPHPLQTLKVTCKQAFALT